MKLKMPVSDALITAILGYLVVFVGLALLMAVVIIMGKIMVSRRKTAAAAVPAAPAAPVPVKASPEAPGSAGEVKIHDVPDREAAMIMAIVADKLHKPLNELRFKSIKEIK